LPLVLLTLLLIAPAIASIAILRSLSLGWYLILLSICLFYGVVPLLITWGGFSLARRFDCQSEAMVFSCSAPAWLGEIVTGMIFTHWLAIVTIPSAVLGCLGLIFSWISKVNPSLININISGTPIAKFRRSRHHKVIAGVCGAIAQQWHLSVLGVRIIIVILAISIPGFFLLLYFWFWMAFPLGRSTDKLSDN
jgi:phage shock protein C